MPFAHYWTIAHHNLSRKQSPTMCWSHRILFNFKVFGAGLFADQKTFAMSDPASFPYHSSAVLWLSLSLQSLDRGMISYSTEPKTWFFLSDRTEHGCSVIFVPSHRWNKFFKRFYYGLKSIRMDENSAFASTRGSNRQNIQQIFYVPVTRDIIVRSTDRTRAYWFWVYLNYMISFVF